MKKTRISTAGSSVIWKSSSDREYENASWLIRPPNTAAEQQGAFLCGL
jgi:hypothetical protein